MSKGFFGNLSLLIVLNVLIKPFWLFGIDRTVQNTVGAEAYGLYFALFNLTLLFNIILELGINNFNSRAIAQNPGNIQQYLPNLLSVKSLVSFIYAFVLLGLGIYLGYEGDELKLLALCTINLIAISFVLYLRSNISGLQFFRVDSFFSVADKSLMIILVGVLLWIVPLKNGFTLDAFVMAQIVANVAVAIAAFIFVKQQVNQLNWHIDLNLIQSLLKKAAPFALIGFLMAVYYRIDGVMLERMLGQEGASQNGMYAAGFRILDAANMFAFLFATILLPLFSKMIAQKENVESLLKFSTYLIFVMVLTMSLSIGSFSQPIMDILYVESNATYGLLLQILIVTSVPIALVYVYGALLAANHNLKHINIIAGLGVLFNIGLNIILIPRYQALGAAMATLSTQGLVAIGYMLVAFKKLELGTHLFNWLGLFVYTILCLVLAYYFQNIKQYWFGAMVLLSVILVILSFVCNILKIADMRFWWAYRNKV